jgi:hypothetical protein
MRLLYLLSIALGPKTFGRFLVFWAVVMAFLFYCWIQQ